ncbi:MAG: MFS transporter, partial [Dehalococcoidia bacterium]|nr:MFS transporter [Dehalococcoidia bacterium]
MKQGRFFYGWVIVGAGLVVWILEPGMYVSFGIFFKPVSAEMGWSRAMVAGASSLTMIMIGILAPFSGALSDRYGPGRLVMASGVLTGLAYALLSRTEALWQFYAFYILVGVGMGICFAPVAATIVRWFEKNRGLALGLATAGAGIGGMVFPPLTHQLISMWGWRSTYLFLGISMGAVVLAVGTLMRSSPQEMGLLPYGAKEAQPEVGVGRSPAGNPGLGTGLSLRQAVGKAAFWIVFLGSTAAVFSFSLVNVHLVPYATDRGITPATAALAMAMLGFGNSLGRLGLGALSDRTGRKRMFFTVLAVSGIAMFSLIIAREGWAFYLFALVFGLACGGAHTNWMALPGELFGLKSIGALTG